MIGFARRIALIVVFLWFPNLPTPNAKAMEPNLPPPSKGFDFQRDIRPILERSCLGCHGAEKQKGDFRLDTREHFYKGGPSGPAIVRGRSEASDLIKMVARIEEDSAMPPKKDDALKAEEIGLLRAWIDAGAPWPEGFILRSKTAGIVALEPEQITKIPAAATRPIDFVQDVQPLFAKHCYACHGPHRQEAGFRLDHKPSLMAGGDLGVAVVPKDAVGSLLLHFVTGLRPEGTMPKKGEPLSAVEIGVLRAWIEQGAEFPVECLPFLGPCDMRV